jgi:hypothetical protein
VVVRNLEAAKVRVIAIVAAFRGCLNPVVHRWLFLNDRLLVELRDAAEAFPELADSQAGAAAERLVNGPDLERRQARDDRRDELVQCAGVQDPSLRVKHLALFEFLRQQSLNVVIDVLLLLYEQPFDDLDQLIRVESGEEASERLARDWGLRGPIAAQ